MFTNLSSVLGAIIGLVVVAFVVVRQFSTRPVADRAMVVVPAAMAIFGVQGLGQLDLAGWVLLAVNVSIGIGLGFARAVTFRVWVGEQGAALMQATRLTALLWAVTIAVKTGISMYGAFSGTAGSTDSLTELLLPVAATVATQNLVLHLRSQDLRFIVAI